MNKRERRKQAKLKIVRDRHNKIVRLNTKLKKSGAMPTEQDLKDVEEMRKFLETTTVFGSLELMEELIKHPAIEEYFMEHVTFRSELDSGYSLFVQLMQEVGPEPANYVEEPMATALRVHTGAALRALRANLTIRNIAQSVKLIKLIRAVDAVRKAKYDLMDLLDLIRTTKKDDLIKAAMLINKKSNLTSLIEKLKGETK